MAAANEWVGGIIASPVAEEGGASFQPAVAVWLDLEDDRILATELCREEESAEALADGLRDALAQSEGRPATLRIAERAWVDTLRTAAGGPVSIIVGETPEIAPLREKLAAFLGEAGNLPGYLAHGGVPVERVERLFDAASRLFAAQPWSRIPEEEVLGVDVQELDYEGACLIVIGSGEEARGFTFFPDLDVYLDFVDASMEQVPMPMGPMLHLGFERENDLGATMRAEIEEHGWKPVAPGAMPALLAMDANGVARDLKEEDYLLATALAEALADLVEEQPGIAEEGEGEIASSHEELPEVRLELPHPEIDSLEEVVIGGFLEVEEGMGDVELAESVANQALDFKHVTEAPPGIWSAAEVEEFLLVYVPKRVSYPEEELERIPAIFARFLRYLGESFETMDSRRIGRLHDLIDELGSRYRLAIADPGRWGPAKRLAMAAMERGIDPTDDAAMAQLVAEVNARQEPAVRQGPKVGRNDPCPCGSGRKHKKCCGA